MVLIALAANESARVERRMRLDVIRRARRLAEDQGDRRLADAVLQRGQKWPESASLFLCARPSQRIEILFAAQRSRLGRPIASSIPTTSASLEELEFAAVARQPELFLALFAEALDYEPELVRKIVDDPTGEPLAVALAALGAANEVLVRILISNDLLAGAAYQRIGALTRLNNALDRNAAKMIVAALRDEPDANRRQNPKAEAKPAPAYRAICSGQHREESLRPVARDLETTVYVFAAALTKETERCRRQKTEGDQYGAENSQADAEPNEGADAGDDRGRSQHDCDLAKATTELVMLQSAVRQFSRFDSRLRSFLDRVEAVFEDFSCPSQNRATVVLKSPICLAKASVALASVTALFCASRVLDAVSTTVDRIFLA